MKHSPSDVERIVRIEAPAKHHSLLIAMRDGALLGVDDGGSVAWLDDADDRAVWERHDNRFIHATTGVDLECGESASDGFTLSRGGAPVCLTTAGEPDRFADCHGPAELPSAYLSRFREQGWVCLTSILDPDLVRDLERTAASGDFSNLTVDLDTPPLLQHSAVAKQAVEPVSLWVMRQYMGTREIRYGHSPSFAILGKDREDRDVQGWHSDFPYLWGISGVGGSRVPEQTSGDLVLGIQRNTCVSEFTRDGGATIFKLGTHRLNVGPPADWGCAGVYRQPGYRAEHGLPYAGSEADVIEAPAGSIILYDSRTWHRAGVNRTNRRRAAILQAVTPMYVMPFTDTSEPYKAFIDGPLVRELSQREQAELGALLVHKVVGPQGTFAITRDHDLTERSRPAD